MRSVPFFRPGVPGLIPDAWIVGPDSRDAGAPVVAVHGINRGAEEMASLLLSRARAIGRTVVVPHFDTTHWPRYQRAACRNRSDWALLRLMQALRSEGQIGAGAFDLSGFSGGAQFAHRFAWLYPSLVGSLCLTAPGWWTFPDSAVSWPYGIGAAPRDKGTSFQMQANLRRFLDRQIIVCVGSDDVQRDGNLRQGQAIDTQQGPNRYGRARRWSTDMDSAARSHGISPAISLKVLQGCGHSFVDCVETGRLDQHFVQPNAQPMGFRSTSFCEAPAAAQIIERKAA